MCLSCASAGLVQAIVSSIVQWSRGDRHINTNEIANAVLGGLVAVTGCCPFIDPPFAIIIGGKHNTIIYFCVAVVLLMHYLIMMPCSGFRSFLSHWLLY